MKDIVLKQYESEVKAVEGERALNVTITTNDVDRSGDIVEPKGAKLANFKKNPVVLMAHDYQGLPIGKASDLTKTDNGITAKVTFPEEGVYPLADTVYNLYKGKFMKAWSIGFIPLKSEDISDDEEEDSKSFRGRRFKTWELLEFSACSVPNNPFALNNMVSKGIDIGLLKEEGLITIVEGKDFEKAEEPEAEIKDILKIPPMDAKDVEDEATKIAKKIIKDAHAGMEPDPIDPDKVKASMEKDEKEEKLGFTLDEIYQTIKENKELKEKIKDLELKAGAVLNAKNKSNLKNAQALVQTVLDSAGTEESLEDEGGETKDAKKDDTVITITKDKKEDPGKDEAKEEKKFTINEKAIAEAVSKTMIKVIEHQLGIIEK